MSASYRGAPEDQFEALLSRMDGMQRRLDELERPSGTQTSGSWGRESVGTPTLLSVITSTSIIGVEALIGDPLTFPVRTGVSMFVTCAFDVSILLRGTGGTVEVGFDLKDQNSTSSSIGTSGKFVYHHTANDEVRLDVPVVTSGVVNFDADPSLVGRVVYSILPGSIDGRLSVSGMRVSAVYLTGR